MERLKSLFEVFWAPSKVFQREEELPNPWIPFAFVILVFFLYLLVTQFTLGQVIAEKAREQIEQLPPNQREAALKALESPVLVYLQIGIRVFLAIFKMFVLAIIYYVTLPLIGGTITFISSLTAVVYANVISLLAIIVKLPISIATKNLSVQTSFALFLQGVPEKSFLYVVAKQLDFFTLWSLVVLGIGLSHLGKVDKKRAIFFVYALWLVWVLLNGIITTRVGGGG
jgi:hypothetical protein